MSDISEASAATREIDPIVLLAANELHERVAAADDIHDL
jgi:hypothetical protein